MNTWITRPYAVFTGVDQVEIFRSMAAIQPARVVRRSPAPFHFDRSSMATLPVTHSFSGEQRDTMEFLAEVETTGLLVVQDDAVRFEQYWLGHDASTQAASWSIVKSYVSALVGVAIRDGLIGNVDDLVSDYIPALEGTGYERATIKHALQMSSGASWDESFNTPASDIPALRVCFQPGGSLDELARSRKRSHPPGQFNHYNSMDTHILAMIVRDVTGKSVTDYLADEIWGPLGMEDDAFWVVDGQGAEFASGGLSATLRDHAKFGRLFLNDGIWGERRILPAGWVDSSVSAAEPHLVPGPRANSTSYWGYGYQWWIPDTSGSFMAVGAGNQFIYVNPQLKLIIVKSTANRNFGKNDDETHSVEQEHLAVFRAIEEHLRR